MTNEEIINCFDCNLQPAIANILSKTNVDDLDFLALSLKTHMKDIEIHNKSSFNGFETVLNNYWFKLQHKLDFVINYQQAKIWGLSTEPFNFEFLKS